MLRTATDKAIEHSPPVMHAFYREVLAALDSGGIPEALRTATETAIEHSPPVMRPFYESVLRELVSRGDSPADPQALLVATEAAIEHSPPVMHAFYKHLLRVLGGSQPGKAAEEQAYRDSEVQSRAAARPGPSDEAGTSPYRVLLAAELEKQRAENEAAFRELEDKLAAARSENERLVAERDRLQGEHDRLVVECDRVQAEHDRLKAEALPEGEQPAATGSRTRRPPVGPPKSS